MPRQKRTGKPASGNGGGDSNNNDHGGWHVQTFPQRYPGKRFLNTGVALYEIMEEKDLARFDENAQIDLYPYRDLATGTLIKPGEEGLFKSSADTTLVIAKIVAGQPWSTPAAVRINIAERLAHQRAEFDLRNGASKQQVHERLKIDLAKAAQSGNTISAAEQAAAEEIEEEEVDWAALRAQIDGGKSGANNQADEADDDAADDNNDADDDAADEDAADAADEAGNGFEEDDDEEEDFDAENGDTFFAAAAEDDDDAPIDLLPGQQRRDDDGDDDRTKAKKKTSRFDAAGGSFGSYGLLSNAPAGAPVLNIDCSRIDPETGYASAAYHDDANEEQDEEANTHRGLLADMDELDRAARGEIYDDEEEEGDDDETDDDDANGEDEDAEEVQPEFDAQGRPILYPNNVELDRKGRVVRRLDNALTGATSQDAQLAQYRRELSAAQNTDRPRKTLNHSAMLAERGQTMNKTLGDELKDFGLPPDMMAMLAQQGALSQQIGDAQFPESIDEIAHLMMPYKGTAPPIAQQATTGEAAAVPRTAEQQNLKAQPNLRTELPPSSSSSLALKPVASSQPAAIQPALHTAGTSFTVPVSLGDLLLLRTNITAQMRAITALSESVDSVLLAKMAKL